MPKLRERQLLKHLLTAAAVLISSPLHAITGSSGPGRPLSPKDNIGECSPVVQRELVSVNAGKWGRFRFDCRDGYVSTLYTPINSPISEKLNLFIGAHWKLFDREPIAIVNNGDVRGLRTIVRKRLGLPFQDGTLSTGRDALPDKSMLDYFYFYSGQSLPDGFNVHPRIPKAAAIKSALELAARRKHLPNKLTNTELVIRHCQKRNWYPSLVWWIHIKESNNASPVTCFIDAESGSACYDINRCDSANDGFAF